MKRIKYPVPIERNNISKMIEKQKKSKYRNKKVLIDGIWFDSQKEGNRYIELKQKEKQGEISDLKLQVKFELIPKYTLNGKTIRAMNYVCDFYYYDNQTQKFVIEDVKASESFQTDIYKLKKKLFMHKYGKEITEIY